MKHFYAYRIFLLLTFFAAFYGQTSAQNFHLVKDINASTDGSPSNENSRLFNNNSKRFRFALLNGITYFSADDGINGRGLWRSDGTEAGTYQIKKGINPTNITVASGKLYFAADGNLGLWMSDGTETGTVKVINQPPPGLTQFIPSGLTDFNGTLFFFIRTSTSENQLWKTDGTASGTTLVKDFRNADPSKDVALLINPIVIKNKLYFSGSVFSPSYAPMLWVTDGTTLGTHIISDKMIEPAQMIAASSDSNDSLVYFSASTVLNGTRSLYVTNGDSGNAKIANGFNGFLMKNYFGVDIANIGGEIYFIGYPTSSVEVENLFKYDPVNGVQPVKVSAAGADISVSDLTMVDGNLYYNVFNRNNNKFEFWKSNGTAAGSILLKERLSAGLIVKANDKIFFAGQDSTAGIEIWKTDGTETGTVRIKDINVGRSFSNPFSLTNINGEVLFSSSDGTHGNEIWRSDGTDAGTILVKDINQTATASSYATGLTSKDNTLFFSAYYNDHSPGLKILNSNGTASGTILVTDSFASRARSYPDTLVIRNNQIYSFGTSVFGRQGIYKTDATSGVTSMVKDFSGIAITVYNIIPTDSIVYFAWYNSYSRNYELWRTDGTEANTYIIKIGFQNFSSDTFASTGNTLYFKFPGGIWKTDGTEAGTEMVKRFDYEPYHFAGYRGRLFFGVYENPNSPIWTSDGTQSGTIRVTNEVNNPDNFIAVNNELFFLGYSYQGTYGNIGTELFRTDGTINGTVLVKDIHPGAASTSLYKSTSLNNYLYFFTNSTTTGKVELWKSDGTQSGTELITEVETIDNQSLPPSDLVTSNGKLFFIIGMQLWESDGTKAGTHLVNDDIFSQIKLEAYNTNLTSVGNQLFFTASNYKYGQELYVGTISKPGVTYYISAADGNWNDPATWTGNVVPPEAASVIIRHNVVGNVNTSCKELRIEEPGNLTMLQDFNIKILE